MSKAIEGDAWLRLDRKYIGNKNTKELHDIVLETNKCQIDDLLKDGNGVAFRPEDATIILEYNGYDGCAHCMSWAHKR